MLINEKDLAHSVLMHGTDIIEYVDPRSMDFAAYLGRLEEEMLDYPRPKGDDSEIRWFIPKEYQDMDIERYLKSVCPAENLPRLTAELELFRKHDMITVLKAMKYLVDTMRKISIVWGVGRGSSVASYALFLIGVHRIDSVKYNLSIDEFFKGEQNG